jgi:hypothetical protein
MHIMGKIGVWLVVIAAAASSVLTAKLVQVRNSWTKKSVGLQKQYQELLPKIAELKEQQAQLEAEYFRSKELWGGYWNNVPTQLQRPAEGVVATDIGKNNGLRVNQTLYGFEIRPDGTAVYRGDFTVTAVQDVQAQLQPKWRVRAEDVQTWAPSAKWRWRNLVPPGYQPVYDQQILAIAKADDLLALRREKLATETGLDAKTQEQLKLREAELVGGPQLPKASADVDYDRKGLAIGVENHEGLLATVELVEENRNRLLREVDDLRRKLRAAQLKIDQRKVDNIELTRKLPQPETSVGSAKD